MENPCGFCVFPINGYVQSDLLSLASMIFLCLNWYNLSTNTEIEFSNLEVVNED